MITATGVVQEYDGHRVLHGVDLTIADGEFVAVMGPSGSGKSTLLHALSGMDRPTGGTVTLGGEDLTALGERELAALRLERIGFVFQQPHLLASLTLADNVALPGLLAGRPRTQVVARARELLAQVGVAEIADHTTTEASGGQLQRVGIARALVNDPLVVFGDEPSGALNRATAAQVLDLLAEVNDRGTTLVVVTHDPAVAARAQRVVVLVDGEIAEDVVLGVWTSGAHPRRLEAVSALLARHGV